MWSSNINERPRKWSKGPPSRAWLFLLTHNEKMVTVRNQYKAQKVIHGMQVPTGCICSTAVWRWLLLAWQREQQSQSPKNKSTQLFPAAFLGYNSYAPACPSATLLHASWGLHNIHRNTSLQPLSANKEKRKGLAYCENQEWDTEF